LGQELAQVIRLDLQPRGQRSDLGSVRRFSVDGVGDCAPPARARYLGPHDVRLLPLSGQLHLDAGHLVLGPARVVDKFCETLLPPERSDVAAEAEGHCGDDARLSRSIGADDDVKTRTGADLYTPVGHKVLDPQADDGTGFDFGGGGGRGGRSGRGRRGGG
jgi:hypothetical protein